MSRTFENTPAKRSQVPLLIGLVSPSGAGKTYSALRLATGIQRVVGGEIFVVDTESRRSLHYADKFKFQHVPFVAPFGPLDYLAAIEYCVSKGAKTIICDSMSHEHEGPGGVLEMHEAEIDRMMKAWSNTTREKVQLGAWAKPKQERRRLINSLLQIPCNFLLCFRAKSKLKVERGKEPTELGWMPIAGDEWIYEQTLQCLLMPGANGVPTWDPEGEGEKKIVKLPEQFRGIFDKNKGKPLSEDTGQALALWAAGDAASANENDFTSALELIRDAASLDELKKVAASLRTKNWSDAQRAAITAGIDERKAALSAAA